MLGLIGKTVKSGEYLLELCIWEAGGWSGGVSLALGVQGWTRLQHSPFYSEQAPFLLNMAALGWALNPWPHEDALTSPCAMPFHEWNAWTSFEWFITWRVWHSTLDWWLLIWQPNWTDRNANGVMAVLGLPDLKCVVISVFSLRVHLVTEDETSHSLAFWTIIYLSSSQLQALHASYTAWYVWNEPHLIYVHIIRRNW